MQHKQTFCLTMKNHLFFIFISITLLFNLNIEGQELNGDFDDVYGLNPILYNGRIYTDYYDNRVKGHQFLLEKKFYHGTVRINNQFFEKQEINYDVYKQKLLLKFKDYTLALRLIEIPLENVQSFSFSNKNFVISLMPDSTQKIFQLIGKDVFNIYVFWSKKLNTTTSTSAFDYQFTDSKKEIWVNRKGKLEQISNNRSLINLFDDAQGKKLKKWLKQSRIKIQKANNQQLLILAEYLYAL